MSIRVWDGTFQSYQHIVPSSRYFGAGFFSIDIFTRRVSALPAEVFRYLPPFARYFEKTGF
ncbi:unnamed protein product [Meloidogyne enterolobii]|uniref:Uncharacterized protein n=1 Tax=Meloidogyne enterolobii TaxID=390850 RepID=A0ACB0YWM1_MELEN